VAIAREDVIRDNSNKVDACASGDSGSISLSPASRPSAIFAFTFRFFNKHFQFVNGFFPKVPVKPDSIIAKNIPIVFSDNLPKPF